MQATHKERYALDAECELRAGIASWDDGSLSSKSIKFTWFNKKDRRAARGGEIPSEALPQMVSFAIRSGYLNAAAVREHLDAVEKPALEK